MDEEIKYTDDLEVEKVENSYKTVSLKESDLESENNKPNNKQKNKKGLKTKIIAWALGLGVFAGGIAGASAGIKAYKEYNTTGNGAYNKILEDKFEQVHKNLYSRLSYACSDYKKVKHINFSDDNYLEVFYDGETLNPVYKTMDYHNCYAIFEYAREYYYSLVNAEQSGNMISYLDALNNLFTTMRYVKSEMSSKIDFVSKIDKTEENNKKLCELFKLETNKDDVVKQIGFLPYDIHITKWDIDFDNNIVNYSYRLSGISYCETKSESSTNIESNDELLIDNSYDKNHIKTYYRDIVISGSYTYNEVIPLDTNLLRIELKAYLNGTKNLEVETTYFEQTNIFDEFFNMKNTEKFDYKKPADLDLTK